MVTVLVVDDDSLFRNIVVKSLRKLPGLTLLEAAGVEPATRVVKARAAANQAVDVLLTDLRMGDGDGLDLIEALPELSPQTMPILMSGVASSRDYQSALRLGAVDVLIKPFSKEALVAAVQRATDSATGFRASIHGLSLMDLLQMFHLARRSTVLEIRGPRRKGLVVLEEGELIHAEADNLEGEPALRRLVAMQGGSLSSTPFRPMARTLQGGFENLLLEAFRVIDEQRNEGEALHPPSEHPPDAALAPAPPGDWENLGGFVGSLDGELGAALLNGDNFHLVLKASLSDADWEQVGGQARWFASTLPPGWKQGLWSLGGFGLALLDWPERQVSVVLAQRFSGALDDRRFRWNVSCVARFLDEERASGAS